MKTLILLLLSMFFVLNFAVKDKDAFNVMTFNLRYDNPDDSLNAWPLRKDKVIKVIEQNQPDFIGTQEGLYHQLQYMGDQLTRYSWFGLGRDDGDKDGEFTAMFYNTERFVLIDQSTFWCSQNPEKPGLGWDAACNRTVTWGKFKDLRTDKEFLVLNTHFDHVGDTARLESSHLILDKIAELAGDLPAILTGDFNSSPESVPYKKLTESGVLKDTYALTQQPHEGPYGTFSGFRYGKIRPFPIDYIFIKGNFEVLNHKTIDTDFNHFYPSDHFPVMTELKIK
ncbi:MAG: endonuclease/exonuclease/phosphatase family protein [Calditrichae bacterium]|nr:endonuclease/exonuclease/phosphatase family protein [Calditrichia bacterium]